MWGIPAVSASIVMPQQVKELQGPGDYLNLLNYLLLKLQSSQESFQEDLQRHQQLQQSCLGQVAVDLIPKYCQLLNQWIHEWLHQEEDHLIQPPETKQEIQVLTFYELLVVCEIYVDSYPEIAQKLNELNLLFLPKCSLIDPSESRPNTSRSQESNKLTGRKTRK